jgi:hypothetical protein
MNCSCCDEKWDMCQNMCSCLMYKNIQSENIVAELHQDLPALSDNFESISSPSSFSNDMLPILVTPDRCEAEALFESVEPVSTRAGHTLVLPFYEELPLLKESHDYRNAVLWFIATIAFLVLFLGRSL